MKHANKKYFEAESEATKGCESESFAAHDVEMLRCGGVRASEGAHASETSRAFNEGFAHGNAPSDETPMGFVPATSSLRMSSVTKRVIRGEKADFGLRSLLKESRDAYQVAKHGEESNNAEEKKAFERLKQTWDADARITDEFATRSVLRSISSDFTNPSKGGVGFGAAKAHVTGAFAALKDALPGGKANETGRHGAHGAKPGHARANKPLPQKHGKQTVERKGSGR